MEAQTPPTEPTAPQPKRLVRTTDDRVIAGVAGGLGRYLGGDPVLFRSGLIALVFLGGTGLLLYGLAWLLVPDEASGRAADARSILRRLGVGAGGVALSLLGFGGGFWGAPPRG